MSEQRWNPRLAVWTRVEPGVYRHKDGEAWIERQPNKEWRVTLCSTGEPIAYSGNLTDAKWRAYYALRGERRP